jgi:transcription initiation factor TFIIB
MQQPQEIKWENIQHKVICRECKEDPPRFTEEYSSGDLVCLSCGLVADIGGSLIDTRAEWRTFSGDGDDSRADPTRAGDGANPYFMGDQLRTRISGEGGDSVALSRTQGKVVDENEKINEKLRKLYASAEAWCAAGGLIGVVVDTSKQYIKLAHQRNWWRSISDDVILACIYNACKEAGVARTMKEISQIPSVPPHWTKQVTRLQKFLAEAKLAEGAEKGSPSDELQHIGEVKSTTAGDMMTRFAQGLKLPYWVVTLGQQISSATSEAQTFDSRGAPTVGGAIMYVLLHLIGQPKPVEDMVRFSGVTRGSKPLSVCWYEKLMMK